MVCRSISVVLFQVRMLWLLIHLVYYPLCLTRQSSSFNLWEELNVLVLFYVKMVGSLLTLQSIPEYSYWYYLSYPIVLNDITVYTHTCTDTLHGQPLYTLLLTWQCTPGNHYLHDRAYLQTIMDITEQTCIPVLMLQHTLPDYDWHYRFLLTVQGISTVPYWHYMINIWVLNEIISCW